MNEAIWKFVTVNQNLCWKITIATNLSEISDYPEHNRQTSLKVETGDCRLDE